MRIDLPAMMFEMPTLVEFTERYKKPKYAQIAFACALKIYWRTVLSGSQNHRCCWCGTHMTFSSNCKNSATIEHVTPKSLGGEDHPDNYAVACNRCNSTRGSLSIDEFMTKIHNKTAHTASIKSVNASKKQEVLKELFFPKNSNDLINLLIFFPRPHIQI